MKIEEIKILKFLTKTEENLKDAHTPKPYEYNLIKELYTMEAKEFWVKYQIDHPYIIIKFFDYKNSVYELVNGELVLIGQ